MNLNYPFLSSFDEHDNRIIPMVNVTKGITYTGEIAIARNKKIEIK